MTATQSNNQYNRNLKEFARKLRNNSTLAEVVLWEKVLRKKQLRGYSFLRQRPIENYIVDFFCKDLKLIVELDGEIHKFRKSKDIERDNNLKENGYSIIRFDNEDIMLGLPNVIKTLGAFIDEFESNR
jgi:very-short-patch-repair endonuclease